MERQTSSGSSARFESFTEAVPLSLSSMAHANLPLSDGVLDGIKKVLQHTLFSCVNYARIVHPPHQWTFNDICTSRFAWAPVKTDGAAPPAAAPLPYALEKLNFKHQYSRSAWIYLRPVLNPNMTMEEELQLLTDDDWKNRPGILGHISLLYTSTEPLTKGEMDGTDTEDMPPTILYKAVVEYRSLPATGNQQAVQAEELSMLSFGGSVDDDVKYGALASLYDEHAKYVLQIDSVRGKRYKFDLMDATLSDGTIPHLPSTAHGDPCVKSLCATVTDYTESLDAPLPKDDMKDEPKADDDKKFAITRINLTLEGKPRHALDDPQQPLPTFDFLTQGIQACFLKLNPEPWPMATALPSGHSLLLDPSHAGRVYVNGFYVATWGNDPRIGSNGVALFGMDLQSIPFWHGRIVDFEVFKSAYARLWHEILVDARLIGLGIASKLLHRLMTGKDPPGENDLADDESYDDDDAHPEVNIDCLESQVLSSPVYDVVGIAAKALATRFAMDFGKDAFPCLAHEVEWVKRELPDRKPVKVPQRVINVLRRGGYFDVQRTSDDLWFVASRPVADGSETELINQAIQLLEQAGCEGVVPEQITFVSSPVTSKDVVAQKVVVKYNEVMQQYCVHDSYLNLAVSNYAPSDDEAMTKDENKIRSYLLGMYLAQVHPDGDLLPRYVLRNRSFLS